MAYASKDGHKSNSKFRQRRYDDAHEGDKPKGKMGGERAQANKMESKPSSEHEEQLEEQVAPGIHDQVDAMSAHGPAHAVHITHDHASGTHHVHSMHPDGHEDHTDHGSAEEAHMHGAKMAGVQAPEEQEEEPEEGEYPQKHKPTPGGMGDMDDFESEPLD